MRKLYDAYTKKFIPAEDGEVYICPFCGEHLSADMILYKMDDEIVGCEFCVEKECACDMVEDESEDAVVCPVCGSELTDEYMYQAVGVVGEPPLGCECCIQSVSAWVQAEEEDEYAREFAEEMRYNAWHDRGFDD